MRLHEVYQPVWPGWNFSPVKRAEISARLPEQIFLKWRLRLHEESFSLVKRVEKPHVIAFKFQPGLKYDLENGHRLSCECKTLSCKLFAPIFKHCARAEIRHVFGPLDALMLKSVVGWPLLNSIFLTNNIRYHILF